MHGRVTSRPLDGQPAGPAPWTTPAEVADLRALVDCRLSALVAPQDTAPVSLNNAIRHALLAPGKRVRPLLAMLTAAEFGLDPVAALDAGCAVELVHTASLVLDDLPCMDDAHTRRGVPATHAAFGEATALLAAITMLSRAFGVLGQMDHVPPAVRLNLVGILSRASGTDGLAAGQERDLRERAPSDTLAKIDAINDQKTGALFIAAIEMGGQIAGVDAARLSALSVLGREVGLAFQTLDDLIDLLRSSSEAGKDTGKDTGKATVATVMGQAAARGEVKRHAAVALAAIEPFTAYDGPLHSFVAAMLGEATAGAERHIAAALKRDAL